MLFYIVDNLPRNLDLILGQEWLLQNDYMMTCPKIIPPYSESVVKVPTKERGVRLIDKKGCSQECIVVPACVCVMKVIFVVQ
jgi:hypothetical protein